MVSGEARLEMEGAAPLFFYPFSLSGKNVINKTNKFKEGTSKGEKKPY